MSDVFISYKREEQAIARLLADALTNHGWTIWWDPQLQAGEYYDDVIEQALIEARCVVVIWSERSVKSRFVKDEATYALDEGKLVPAQIEDVRLPFRFANLQTVQLFGWTGSEEDPEFKRLKRDIEKVLFERRSKPTSAQVQTTTVAKADDRLEDAAEFRDRLADGSQGPLMVSVPTGQFAMGSEVADEEKPVHEVTIDSAFAIGKYPVTFQEYDYFASITGRLLPEDNDWGRYQRPVINVSWHDAVAYINWLSEQTGKTYRLPSEAQWEYVARAGTDSEYWWGDDFRAYADNAKIAGVLSFPRLFPKRTTEVGRFSENPFGVCDTAGNVFEWVNDCWHVNYAGAPDDGTSWLESMDGDCALRVLRGGAWNADGRFQRSAARHKYHPGLRYPHVGFRIARET